MTDTPQLSRFDQPQRWIGEGLEALGDGIKWAGFWIGLGIAFRQVIELFIKGALP